MLVEDLVDEVWLAPPFAGHSSGAGMFVCVCVCRLCHAAAAGFGEEINNAMFAFRLLFHLETSPIVGCDEWAAFMGTF